MSAAVASRSSVQHPMLRSSRPGTPSFFGFGSPSIHQPGSETKLKDGMDSPSRSTRAASDPPPSESAKRSSHFLRSTFETEPNPFEQSFSASAIRSSDTRSTARDGPAEESTIKLRRARSTSPASGARTPAAGGVGARLPSVSNIPLPVTNPQHEPHAFGWSLDHSLRTGPLSPAMLHGPTPGSLGFGMSNYFDPNNFRTGLTPSVHGGTSSFAPQSPATAALFAMMTNSGHTPDSNGLTSGPLMPGLLSHAPGMPNMPNHFEAGFRSAMEAAVHKGERPDLMPPGIGLQNPSMSNFATQAAPKPLNADQRANVKANVAASNGLPPPRMPFMNQPDLSAVHPSAVLVGGGPPNPLFLLSQATTGDVNNGDDAVLAATALSSLNVMQLQQQQSYSGSDASTPQNKQSPVQAPSPAKTVPAPGPPRAKRASTSQNTTAGKKRKSAASADDVEPPPPATRGRKKGSTTKKQKMEMDEDPDSDDGQNADSGPKIGQNGKPIFETEEEKRKNFLERNRQAALKCRQRKKAWLSSLQTKVEYLTADNETLQATIQQLRDEIGTLRSVLIGHKDCPVFNSNVGGMTTIGKILGADSQLPHAQLPPPRASF